MRTGRLSPSWSPSPGIARLTGGHEAHRAAQAATLELIAHAILFSASPTALPSLLYQHDGRCGGHPGNVG